MNRGELWLQRPTGVHRTHEVFFIRPRPRGALVRIARDRSRTGPGMRTAWNHCRADEVGRYLTPPEDRTLFRSRRRLIVHVLSLVLLIAQLGMQAHAFSHLKSDPDGVPGTPTQLCGQCASSAPLLSMASGSLCIRVPYQSQTIGIAPASIDAAFLPLPHPAFRSRAPPHLL